MESKRIITYVALSTLMVACSGPQGGTSSSSSADVLSSYAAKGNLRVSLTDAPKNGLKEVNVNVDHIELFLKKGSTEKRLIIGQDMGMVNLLSLRNGVLLPIADINMPEGVDITNIRLVLKEDNNHAIKDDYTVCDMKTPSAQQSGVKIMLKTPVHIEKGYRYSMVVDFDAEKSVVLRGNGSCLLKPVIKLLQVTRQQEMIEAPVVETPGGNTNEGGTETSTGTDTASSGTEGSNTNPEVPVTDGTDSNVGSTTTTTSDIYDSMGNLLPPDQLGFDIYDPATYPDGITAGDLSIYF